MSTYAIGDVQGCYDALMRLLEKLDYSTSDDTLWFAGDLINRGPQSLQTLQFIHSLGSGAVCVLGNHDLHLLAAAVGTRKPHKRDTFNDILMSSQRDELLHWLRHQVLLHHDTTLGYAMAHAGIYPGWSLQAALGYAAEVQQVLRGEHYHDFFAAMYGNQPDRWSQTLSGYDRLRFIVNSFTRMRYCRADGQLDLQHSGPPGSQPAELSAWFKHPNQLTEPVKIIFGHWASLGTIDLPGFYPLDTGCVWGGSLTALTLETGERICVHCDRVLEPRPHILTCT